MVIRFWRGNGYLCRADIQGTALGIDCRAVARMGKGTAQEMSQHMKYCMDRCTSYRISFLKYHVHREKIHTYKACREYCRREVRLQRIKDARYQVDATLADTSDR